MKEEEVRKLLKRHKQGLITKEENLLLENWFRKIINGEPEPDDLVNYAAYDEEMWNFLLEKEQQLNSTKIIKLKSRKALSIAAAIVALLAVGGAGYWLKLHSVGQPQKYVRDIAPGTNKATLTLSSGKTITLDDSTNGSIAQTQDITINKTDQGRIIYTKSNGNPTSAAAEEFNTITTPKGGQYEVTLQDGTQVWLNAGSKLTFPVSFNGRAKREVTLTGEAYFEVTKHPLQPFLVHSTNQLVTVTGTHFDVSCYLNEPLVTTLAEGGVTITQPKTGNTRHLTPGEQSTVTISEGIQVKKVNPADYTAWKDDQFVFVQTPMEQVFAQIGRWYNVDIDYGGVRRENFDGRISRRIPLTQVLHALEISTDLKFKVVERRIMVTQ